jgi:hypothetical protein
MLLQRLADMKGKKREPIVSSIKRQVSMAGQQLYPLCVLQEHRAAIRIRARDNGHGIG